MHSFDFAKILKVFLTRHEQLKGQWKFGIVYTEIILTIADFQKRGKYYEEKIIQEQYR